MKSNTQFSIRLANGKEETFETAAAMAAWVALQRQFDAPRRRNRFSRRANRKPVGVCAAPIDSSEPPLARYANRNSSRT